MSKKKKKKKKTALPVNQQATTRSGGITTYYRKGKECHCASKRPAGSTEERDRRRAKRSERQRLLTSVFAKSSSGNLWEPTRGSPLPRTPP